MNRRFAIQPRRYRVQGLEKVETPRILFYEWALTKNRDRLVRATGGLGNVRLMTKTVKSTRLLSYYTSHGLRAIKCSCVDEARAMARARGVTDVLVTVLLTWVYNNTNRSIFAAMLLHTTFNWSNFLFTTLFTDMGGQIFFGLLIAVVVAVVVVWGPRKLVRES